MYLEKPKKFPIMHQWVSQHLPGFATEVTLMKAIAKYGSFDSPGDAAWYLSNKNRPEIRIGHLKTTGARYKQHNGFLEFDEGAVEIFERGHALIMSGQAIPRNEEHKHNVPKVRGGSVARLVAALWSLFVALGDDFNRGKYGTSCTRLFQKEYYGRDLYPDLEVTYVTDKK